MKGWCQFLDTNILVYAYDITQEVKHTQASRLLLSLWESGLGCLSFQVLQEFYVSVTRKSEFPLSPEEAAQVVSDFSDWPVHRPGLKDILSAIDLHQRCQVSFWDAMIVQSARQSGFSVLWSEDLFTAETYNGIKVINPLKIG
jgi:predicted nucleic acid-binding protein